MRPAPFDYVRPETLADAVDVLSATSSGNASVLAGGQVLLLRLRSRLERPDLVVDISGLGELAGVRQDGDDLVVGALTTIAELADSSVSSACPALADAARGIGDPQVRNRATAGGNVLNPDPVSDIAPVLLASGGALRFRGGAGDRVVPAHEFFVRAAPRPEPGEILTELRFARTGVPCAYVKFARRAADAPMVGAAAFVRVANGSITEVGLAFSGVHDHPIRAHTVEQDLTGAAFDPDATRAAVERFAAELRPAPTTHAEADYRRQLATVAAVRAIQQALSGTE